MTTLVQTGSLWLAQFGFTWLIQSVVLTAVGLAMAGALRRWGAAVQSAIYRATLAAVLVAPTASVLAGALGFNGWSIPLSALEIEVHEDAQIKGILAAGNSTTNSGAASAARKLTDSALANATPVPPHESDGSPAALLAARQALATAP